MRNQIQDDYRNWLIGLTCTWCSNYGSYQQLMQYLYSREFIPIYPNDGNRAQDGVDMRFRFVEMQKGLKYTYHDVYNYMPDRCNMLEMMAALAQRCEDHIMGDPDIGDRSGVWFYNMIVNMHLSDMTDDNFDVLTVERAITRVIEHSYARNGDGGLFSVKNPNIDMRTAEIWYQMNWYLGELYDQY